MTQPFEAEDLLLYKSIADIQACPDTSQVTCCVTSIVESNAVSKLWNVPLNGNEPWQITQGPSNDIQPRWSSSGAQLAFISDRAGTSQMFLIPRSGGEARQVTQLEGTVFSFEWHPTAEMLLVIAAVPVDPDLRGHRSTDKAPQRSDDAPQVIWKLSYKADGVGYTLDHEAHLFTVDLLNGNTSRLTDGPFNVRSASWSPDGELIAYVRDRELDESHRCDIWLMRADGGADRQLTTAQSQALFPAWSPDQRSIVFSGTVAEGDAQVRLWLIDLTSGDVQPFGDESLEISTEGASVRFCGDSSRISAVVAHRGVQNVAELGIHDPALRWITAGDRHVSNLAASGDYLVYTSETPVHPREIYCCKRDGSAERKLTAFNIWWDDRHAATFERRSFSVPEDETFGKSIDGWLIRPVGANGPTPLLVDVHGGPASFSVFSYPATAYRSMMWSQGWSILALNAAGSASYGRAFCDRLRGRWGRLDLPQQLAAVRQLQDDGLAAAEVAIVGASYGGFMACWAVGHTDLFRAAVAMAPVVDIETHLLTSDGGYYSDPSSMNADNLPLPDSARDLSPWRHVANARTPTLILQGKEDERCPRGQAESFFVALRRGPKPPCELVMYPGVGHGLLTQAMPSNRIDILKRIQAWLLRWTE
jgi:dipeptidyl aminopeptidase/acylaminoacyl peptidase